MALNYDGKQRKTLRELHKSNNMNGESNNLKGYLETKSNNNINLNSLKSDINSIDPISSGNYNTVDLNNTILNNIKSSNDMKTTLNSVVNVEQSILHNQEDDVKNTVKHTTITNVSSQDESKEDDADIREEVLQQIIKPEYYKNIKEGLAWRDTWKSISNICLAISKFLTIVGAVFAFSAGFWNYTTLSFVSGVCCTLSLGTMEYSSFSIKQSIDQTEGVNQALEKLKLKDIPNMVIDISHDVSGKTDE
jgi:hypothetical protein